MKTTALATAGVAFQSFQSKSEEKQLKTIQEKEQDQLCFPLGDSELEANEAAWEILKNNGRALDAVEAGVKIPEGDPNERSVGYGGRSDRDGRVTLDAYIMDEFSNIGSVACLEHIKHPISVARAVMEKHLM